MMMKITIYDPDIHPLMPEPDHSVRYFGPQTVHYKMIESYIGGRGWRYYVRYWMPDHLWVKPVSIGAAEFFQGTDEEPTRAPFAHVNPAA